MNEVVINNVWRTKFYGYCDNVGKRCMHWEIEFPESELNKLEPFVHAGRKVKFKNEDGSIEEWNCPPITYVKNHRFIHNGSPCDIFSAIGFRTNERGENVCYTTAFFPIDYRRYKEGDTIRITGDHGQHLFNIECGNIELNKGVELGVECVLVRGEDTEGTVVIPRGILANGQTYLDARCIELVQAVEDKPAVLERIDDGPNSQLYTIDDSSLKYSIARIWFDPGKVPSEVVKAFAEDIKAFCDKKINNSKKEIETYKTYFKFDAKTTEACTYDLTEEEKDRFKQLPTPCAVIGFKSKNINPNIKITKDVRRVRIEPDFLGVGEQEYDTYTVTCYLDGEEIDSVSTKSIIKAGEIAQSYETFIKYYN